jgi:hypothetical protein
MLYDCLEERRREVRGMERLTTVNPTLEQVFLWTRPTYPSGSFSYLGSMGERVTVVHCKNGDWVDTHPMNFHLYNM